MIYLKITLEHSSQSLRIKVPRLYKKKPKKISTDIFKIDIIVISHIQI